MPVKERRRFIRVKEQDAISYSIIPDGKSERKLVKDLSLGGVRFISEHFIPIRSVLKLEIKLKYAQRVINAIASVVSASSAFGDESYEVGAQFIEIKAEDLNFLKDYIGKYKDFF